ncbi:MAG: protein phosphatase 2C domain-containing protein, partial [Lentisphaerae bacterium]|nr:protein phosphatase 2C domain-containing protein [Lentisphaerota bacterium]
LGWVQVGDGGMVVQRHGVTEHIGATDHHEFANLTEFVTAAAPLQGLHCGMVPTTGIAGIAGFTDGTAARMLRSSDRLPAPAFAGLWKTLRQGDLTDADLARFLLRTDWEPSVTDDRSLALLANATTAAMTPAAGPEPHTAATPPAEAACHNAQPGEAPPAPEPAPAERPLLPGTGLIPPP